MPRIYLMWYACLTTFWRQSTHLEGAWKERTKLSVFKLQSESFNIEALTTHTCKEPDTCEWLIFAVFDFPFNLICAPGTAVNHLSILGGKETMTFRSYLCIFNHCYFTILMVSIRLPRYCILQDSIIKKMFLSFHCIQNFQDFFNLMFLSWLSDPLGCGRTCIPLTVLGPTSGPAGEAVFNLRCDEISW